MHISFLRMLFVFCFIAMPSQAQDIDEAAQPELNPYKFQVREKAAALRNVLSEKEQADLAMIRKGFGAIRSVQLVRKEVTEAVKLCIKNMPDIQDEMVDGYKHWQDIVQPVLDKHKSRLENSISEGFFADPVEIEEFLRLIDQAAQYETQANPTIPIATKSSCKRLKKKLYDTPERLVDALNKTEWPAPSLVLKPSETSLYEQRLQSKDLAE